MNARAYAHTSWTDRANPMPSRGAMPLQPSLALTAGSRTSSFSPRVEPGALGLLPLRSDEWMALARSIPPEEAQIWVPLTWPCRILEFISTPKQWACLWPCGGIETFAPDDRRRRVVFMRPEEAYAVHQKHPLVDISLNAQTLTLRFRRPSETPGTINAEPALRRSCHLPVTGRHKEQAV